MQIVMIVEAVIIGMGVNIISLWLNRKVVHASYSEMKVWYGWIGGLVLRFIGLAASGLYIAVNRSGLQNTDIVWFLVTVLGVVLAGLVVDLLVSIGRIGKIKKAGF